MMRVLHVGAGAFAKKYVAEETAALPMEYALLQNYPNPFNPSTNIKFQLPKEEHVELKVYNLLGQEVRSLVNKDFTAGTHSIVWNGKNNLGDNVSSGIYIYKLIAGNYSESKKMNLVR